MKLDYGLVVTTPPNSTPLPHKCQSRITVWKHRVQDDVLESEIFLKDMRSLVELYLHIRIY